MPHLVSSEDIRKIVKEEIKHLPSKDDFFGKMDEVMGELKTIREEVTLLGGRQSENSDQLEDHEERIGRLEKSHSPEPKFA
jgi:hypothetical protein